MMLQRLPVNCPQPCTAVEKFFLASDLDPSQHLPFLRRYSAQEGNISDPGVIAYFIHDCTFTAKLSAWNRVGPQ